MEHPRFDLDRWTKEFPIERCREEARASVLAAIAANASEAVTPEEVEERVSLAAPRGDIVVGPRDVAFIEQLRTEGFGDEVPRNGVPTDVFVWAKGEPEKPFLTKVGGVPFRSRNKPWPRAKDGRTLIFLAQLSFVDSHERLPKRAPGDVLLVFADPTSSRDDDVSTEFVSADEPAPLRPEDVPEEFLRPALRPADLVPPPFWGDKPLPKGMTDPLTVVHGVLHRAYDYPGAEVRFRAYERPENLAVFEATKVGGVPRFIQHAESESGFLGAISSVMPRAETRFPWANEERALTWSEAFAQNHLGFGDAGSLYLFRRLLGGVRATMQSY